MSNERHRWHVAVNRYADAARKTGAPWAERSFMYEAMEASGEVARLTLLFGRERRGELSTIHKQCSRSPSVDIHVNFTTCCLGVRCSACPFLQAIEAAELSDDEKDAAKAWTCVTHIISKGGDPAREGYVLTRDDRLFWDTVYDSLATPSGHPDDEESPHE